MKAASKVVPNAKADEINKIVPKLSMALINDIDLSKIAHLQTFVELRWTEEGADSNRDSRTPGQAM